MISSTTVHIALVDLALPLDDSTDDDPTSVPEGGPRLLELLGRLETQPPTVVVKRGKGRRDDERTLCRALRAGAFAVLERPVRVETALEVMRRILQRYYQGCWPGTLGSGPPDN